MSILWKAAHIACNINHNISPYRNNPETSLNHHSRTNHNDALEESLLAKCSFSHQYLPVDIVYDQDCAAWDLPYQERALICWDEVIGNKIQ